MIEKYPIFLNPDPRCWSVTYPGKSDKLTKTYGMPVLKVAYGYKEREGKPSLSATCLMRESVYQALCDGTFIVLTADNETGFIVVDRAKKLSTPVIEFPLGDDIKTLL